MEQQLNPVEQQFNPVTRPAHYNQHPSGIEPIQFTKWMNFCLGSAMKYIWRADLKFNAIEDLEKAKQMLEVEIARRKEMEVRDGEPTT